MYGRVGFTVERVQGRMRIAVASGKGGTGKTTIAVNMAVVAAEKGIDVTYVDCDVEEPNGHIFLRPAIERSEVVTIPSPQVDETRCTACGDCGRICQFKAILVIADRILTFPELCHGCGGCALVCPAGAITEVPRETGRVEVGRAVLRNGGGADGGCAPRVIQGILNVGEPMAPPVIRRVKQEIRQSDLNIIDAPPGASCPVVESVRGSDFVLLVTEPTPFGLSDLRVAVEMIRQLGIPLGVAVNRSNIGDGRVRSYCADQGIDIISEIPEDRRVAEVCSSGRLAALEIPAFGDLIEELLRALMDRIHGERTGDNKR